MTTTLLAQDFRLGKWQVRPQLSQLEHQGEVVRVEPRSMAVLVDLARHEGEVRSKRRLIRAVWGEAFVTDEVLTHAIWELRKALDDDARAPRFIQTIPKKGYRLVASVVWEHEAVQRKPEPIFHYRILELVGRGGMGEVYKALDTKLNRTVALKVLPAALSHDRVAKQRFLREAQAAAALDHPNIASVFETGVIPDGRMYLTMSYCEGETLEERLKLGPLPLDEALCLSRQVAEGLAAAHRSGVIHRDIKPANVMVNAQGQARILDFGLAKMAGAPTLTRVGSMPGTPAYMSPEQVRGETVDERTDLWSLGATLYELIAGRSPFQAATPIACSQAVLHDRPQQLPGVPWRVTKVINRCLEKKLAKRYSSAAELLQDLEALSSQTPAESFPSRVWIRPRFFLYAMICLLILLVGIWGLYLKVGSRTPGVSVGSLAVLPFENLSGDPEKEYLADGLTEAVITEFARIRALKRVTARTSVMHFKGSSQSLTEVARALNANMLLTGAVFASGDHLQITAQLLDPSIEAHLWTETYRGTLDEFLWIQGDLMAEVAHELPIVLTPQEETRFAARKEVEPEVHRLYLKGRFYWYKGTEEALLAAIDQYKRALDRDPKYAPAYAGLVEAYLLYGQIAPLSRADYASLARGAALDALVIEEAMPEVHTSLGQLLSEVEWDWKNSEKRFLRAMELAPNYSPAYLYYSQLLGLLGRHEEAVEMARRAKELDPLAPHVGATLLWQYAYAHRYDQALAEATALGEIHSGHWLFEWSRGALYVLSGRYEEAIEPLEESVRLSEGAIECVATLGWAYASAGRDAAAREVLRGLEEQGRRESTPAFYLALIHTALGETDLALDSLDESYRQHELLFPLVAEDPAFEPLHGEPRFEELVGRLKLTAG